MSLASMLSDTVDVLDLTVTGEDDFGNQTGTWTPTQTARPARIRDNTGGDSEDRDGQEVSRIRRLCYLDPAGGTIDDRQRIRWNSVDWFIVSIHPVQGRTSVHHYRVLIEEAH